MCLYRYNDAINQSIIVYKTMEVLSIVVALLAFTLSLFTFILTYQRDKVRETINAYLNLQEFLYQYYEYSEGEIEAFVNEHESDEYKSLSASLAQIEVFATGVRKRIDDFDVVFKIAHGYLDGALRDKIEHMLDMKTRKHPELYSNTRWLLDRMDSTPISSEK